MKVLFFFKSGDLLLLKSGEFKFANYRNYEGRVMNGLQLHWKWVEWAGSVGAGSGYLRSEYIICLWAFYQDHKSTLCKCKLPVVECAFFLACLGVFAFFCKYHDRKKRM